MGSYRGIKNHKLTWYVICNSIHGISYHSIFFIILQNYYYCHIGFIACFIHAGCGERLASAGYAVFGVDYEGHGRSGGVRCLITKFDNLVDDCDDYFRIICGGEVSVSCFISNNSETSYVELLPPWLF